jgi:hypothetical protein
LFDIIEVFLANLLSFWCIEIKFVEALVQQLVGADHCLLQLRELFGQPKVVDVGEGA